MAKANAKDYQTLCAELDEVLTKLQDADVSIDESAALYERGLKVAAELEQHVKAVENTITKQTTQGSVE
ncbi:MAG TPA: exodeoxyribonuclease VII small subunit [Candidatus Saccharimonadales bacterium]|nr:exodeoxyribonuclease VII small subunit [Candidatus Saccharimonadales bacterium]